MMCSVLRAILARWMPLPAEDAGGSVTRSSCTRAWSRPTLCSVSTSPLGCRGISTTFVGAAFGAVVALAAGMDDCVLARIQGRLHSGQLGGTGGDVCLGEGPAEEAPHDIQGRLCHLARIWTTWVSVGRLWQLLRLMIESSWAANAPMKPTVDHIVIFFSCRSPRPKRSRTYVKKSFSFEIPKVLYLVRTHVCTLFLCLLENTIESKGAGTSHQKKYECRDPSL